MNYTLFTISAAISFVLSILLSAGPPAYAQTPTQSRQNLTLPLHFSHAGLTFAEPLAYSNQLPVQAGTISFSIPETLEITSEETNRVLGEVVILPNVTNAMILPVLPSQLPPASFQTKPETTKTPTPTIKSLPTALVSTSPTAVPATASPVTPTSNAGGLDAEKLFSMSNAYRQSRGLPAFQKDERACSLAASRAPEIAAEVAGGYMHAGLQARNLPYWNSENIISMRTEEAAFNWWVNDKIHHDAIIGNYTYSCVACSGNNCAQEFTNFQPK